MMAEHGQPCNASEASFCMNGGKCFKIDSVYTLKCVCNANFEGSRCEHFQLISFSRDSEEQGMIAAVVIFALLILVLLGVVIYYICKIKRKGQSQPKSEEYQAGKSSSEPV